ncbi:unnamed protein product [Lasius platythorax]|uniref:Uncharacterized protein n=1 Tax=Lasius platythorax TaxID=488582 RepID=A0AAV2NDE0_9HYME
MMIKLFLISLFCATLVFADTHVEDFQDALVGPVNGFLSMAHFRSRVHGNSLVRRSALEKGGEAEFGFGFGIGFNAAVEEGKAGAKAGFQFGFNGGAGGEAEEKAGEA